MVSIVIDINNGRQRTYTNGYHDCNVGHVLVFGAYVKVGESLCVRDIVWTSIIVDHKLRLGGIAYA